jgi:hypothetical protein
MRFALLFVALLFAVPASAEVVVVVEDAPKVEPKTTTTTTTTTTTKTETVCCRRPHWVRKVDRLERRAAAVAARHAGTVVVVR